MEPPVLLSWLNCLIGQSLKDSGLTPMFMSGHVWGRPPVGRTLRTRHKDAPWQLTLRGGAGVHARGLSLTSSPATQSVATSDR